MHIVSKGFSTYLQNTYNFASIIDRWKLAFQKTHDYVVAGKYISSDFKSTLSNYPKYPNNFQWIKNISNYNSLKIRESSLDSVDQLMDFITNEGITLKSYLDDYPTTRDQLGFDIDLQTTYFTSKTDLYPYTKYFLNHGEIISYDNLLYEVIGLELEGTSIATCDFTQLCVLFNYLSYIIPRTSDRNEQLINSIIDHNLFSKTNIQTGLSNLVTGQITTITSELKNLILRNIYGMLHASTTIQNDVVDILESHIPELLDSAFGQYLDELETNGTDHNIEVAKLCSDALVHTMILGTIKDVGSGSTGTPFFDDINNGPLTLEEDTIIQDYLNQINQYNLRPYLFLAYLYKFWPLKFLNTLPEISRLYIENIIMTPDDEPISENEINNLINSIIETDGLLNRSAIESYITNVYDLDLNSTFSTWVSNYESGLFAVKYYSIGVFDNFIESDYFREFIQSSLYQVRELLRTNGHVSNQLSWYKCVDVIKLYFKSYFRLKICDNQLMYNNTGNDIQMLMERFIKKEDSLPSTSIHTANGYNRVFNVEYQLKDDGVANILFDGSSISNSTYVVDGRNKRIIFNRDNIPPDNTIVTIYYYKFYTYDDYSTHGNTLEKLSEQIIENSAITTQTFEFIKNMYLSVLTKQTLFNILDYYSYTPNEYIPPDSGNEEVEGQVYTSGDEAIYDSNDDPVVSSDIIIEDPSYNYVTDSNDEYITDTAGEEVVIDA